MTLCIDASVVIPWLLPLPASPAARRFWVDSLEAAFRLVAPPLIFAETTSVLRRYVHMGRIIHEEAVAALGRLFQLPLLAVHSPDLYVRALDLARRLGHPRAYDVQYLAVAEMEGCPLVTIDRGLYQSALTLGVAARLLP